MDNNRKMIQDSARASLTLLYNVSRALASITDLRNMLSRVLSQSVQSVGSERGSMIVLDPEGQPVDAALIYNGQLQPHTVEQLKVTLDRGLAGWVYRHREPVLVPDTSKDERWLRRPDDDDTRSGSKSAVCVPLMAREQLVGILTLVHSKPNFFNEDLLALVQAIGDQAGIAVRNAQLYDSLNETRRRYYELFEDSADPIFITNREGRILEANRQAEAATSYSIIDLQEFSIYDLHEPNREKLGENLEALLSGPAVIYESKLRTRSGNFLPVEFRVHRVNFEAHQNLQWIAHDISERKRLESLQDDLTSMIYHDLRSPLANVFSSLEVIEGMLSGQENSTIAPVVQIALRSTDRVQRLTSSLLDIRRLEAGQPITNRRTVNTRSLLEEVREFLQPMIETKKQRLVVEIGESYPALFVDADMIRRVLLNLLENGSKFTPTNGELSFGARVQEEENSILFWVRDTGRGISPEAQEKIFDKFISLQAENMPRGLGLGLAFCRLAVQAHGGKIWVDSEVGQGSTFYFSLPAAQNT